MKAFEVGVALAPQVKFMDMKKCTNQEKRVVCVFGTKLGHELVLNSYIRIQPKLEKTHNFPPL